MIRQSSEILLRSALRAATLLTAAWIVERQLVIVALLPDWRRR
jgi:hypothetical protein